MTIGDDYSIEERFKYIHETFLFAMCEFTLSEMIFNDFIKEEPICKDLKIIVLDALFRSAAINTWKLLDDSKNSYNIYHLVNSCNQATKERNSDLSPIKVTVDKDRVKRLKDRRNKSFAHPDPYNIAGDISEVYPLYISDVKEILNSLSETISRLSTRILGVSVGGRNIFTGEYSSLILDRVRQQYDYCKTQHSAYLQMAKYMKKYAPDVLLQIIYSQEDITNGQT